MEGKLTEGKHAYASRINRFVLSGLEAPSSLLTDYAN